MYLYTRKPKFDGLTGLLYEIFTEFVGTFYPYHIFDLFQLTNILQT
jgi:hypothetical protein